MSNMNALMMFVQLEHEWANSTPSYAPPFALSSQPEGQICTPAKTGTMLTDVRANHEVGETAFREYVSALQKLRIVDDLPAWSPAIRSKNAIRTARKRNLIDPSLAVAALGATPECFDTDFKTLGFWFEPLRLPDLKLVATGTEYGYGRDDGVIVVSIGCLAP